MKKLYLFILGILIFYSVVVDAAVTKEEPFISLGTDFLVIKYEDIAPQINVWFNNTNIYIDKEDDGVWDYKYTKNAGEELYLNILPIIGIINNGARIHTDKPVEYLQHLQIVRPHYYSSYTTSYTTVVPSLNILKSSYYIHDGNWFIVAPEAITVDIDIDNNGSIDNSINISKLTRGQITIPSGRFAKVNSSKPFYLFNPTTIVGPGGTDFYIPTETIQKLIITESNTTIEVDTNNDGHYDQNFTNNSGVYENLKFNKGAHVYSNKSILIFEEWGGLFYIPPSNMIGNDIWSKTDGKIIGLFNTTTYYLDKVTENDLIHDYITNISVNTENSLPGLGKTHLWSNKPTIEMYYGDVYGYYSNGAYYSIFPYSSISVTQQSKQKYLGANETTTMEVRIFNPFANTTINNLTATVRFPNLFFWLDESVEIEKKYIMNDSIVENSIISVIPTDNQFSLNLSSLEPMQYFDIGYQLRTPLQIGSFEFEPVNIGYEADTWNMPG